MNSWLTHTSYVLCTIRCILTVKSVRIKENVIKKSIRKRKYIYRGLAADRVTNLLASDGVPLLAAAGTASGNGHSWGSSGRGLQRLLGSILCVSPLSYLLCPFLFFLYSSLIPSAVISPHSPSTHCPHLHRNTVQYCPELLSFNPTYPSSHCSSFLFPNSKTSWNNILHVLFIIPPFHSFLYSLQLAFYSHSSIQTALTKPPMPTMV